MRIGLSSTTIEPDITQGKIDGIGMYTRHLYDEFAKRQQHIVPCSFPNGINKSSFTNGKVFDTQYTKATLISLFNPFSIHHRIENELDIYHSTDHMVPKFKKIPVIATLNDALMLKHPEWYNAKYRTLKNWLRKHTMKWADHFITISHTMVAELVEYWGVKENKISVIYDGITPEWFEEISAEQKQAVLQRLNLPQQFLLFTGTIQPKKNIARLIEAFLRLPKDIQADYPLVIVGKIGWETEQSLAAIQKLRASQHGYWVDYVSTEDLRALFQSATLYVYPSLHEGFGLTLLEAFASKTPVVTSNISALPETANGAAYLIDPYDIDAISEAIKTLLANRNLCDVLTKKGYARAKEFSWGKCAEETLLVYKTILE